MWDLELLLLLHRDESRGWDAESLVRELRASAGIVASALATLTRAELVARESDGLYRYHAATPEIDGLVRQLEKAYADFPFAVTQAIFSSPNDKIRIFADAFRFKKD